MSPKQYLLTFPRQDRKSRLVILAKMHGCSESTAYRWLGHESHPTSDDLLRITETWSNNSVTRFDLLPNHYNLERLSKLMAADTERLERFRLYLKEAGNSVINK